MATRFIVDAEMEAAHRLFDTITGRVEDPRHGLHGIATEMRRYEKYVFSTRDRRRWKPTVESQGRILVDTGNLLRSLTVPDAKYAVEKVDHDSVYVGTTHPAAIMHQQGRRNMPRRNPAPRPSPTRVKAWAKVFLGALVGDVE